MIVLILERVSPGLRGELTRWLHEPRTNVFVGRTSSKVRDLLWKKIRRELGPRSGALLIHNSDDEPGFRLHAHGDTTRRLVSFDGLQLIQKDHPNPERALRKLGARLPQGERRTFDPTAPPGARPDTEPTHSDSDANPKSPNT